VPDEAHVCHEKSSEVALIRRQIPNPCNFAVYLLIWQQIQLLVFDNGAAELQVAVQLCGIIRSLDREILPGSLSERAHGMQFKKRHEPVDSLHRSEQPRTGLDQTGEHELITTIVELGHDVQGLGVATETGIG
jgi:hypothetical protein